MLASSHSYFAYGSNLCVNQMARRCPDATDPRPATLADHDWLINERGVATVEPFDGSQVHGVVWQLDDHDLATLDSAEGVPVRYRRDRLTVHTDDGPAEAWVYIDHRVDPGPPRPGYLERIIDGAHHHGLPHRWIEFLRRWDPSQWPVPKDNSECRCAAISFGAARRSRRARGKHASVPVRLHGDPRRRAGADDRRHRRTGRGRGGRIGVPAAPSGELSAPPAVGALPGRGVRAARGVPRPRRRRDLAARLRPVGPQHPAARRRAQPRARRTRRRGTSTVPGYHVVTDLDAIPRELRGMHPDNPVNRVRGGGAQLELTPRLRGISPRSAPADADGLSPPTSALIQGLVAAAHSWKSS